ncbi:hyphally regulated cell wall protein 3-like [Lycium ferocissimum]|uniref:hyphally regulated cell wall protein 3-like n=1 Tax=Lycium ferocissimum TaxID=112874 RepID=UPI0028149A9E|nr:hyphally regulated cell wall protein 3-like [Lycium ferocissimum]
MNDNVNGVDSGCDSGADDDSGDSGGDDSGAGSTLSNPHTLNPGSASDDSGDSGGDDSGEYGGVSGENGGDDSVRRVYLGFGLDFKVERIDPSGKSSREAFTSQGIPEFSPGSANLSNHLHFSITPMLSGGDDSGENGGDDSSDTGGGEILELKIREEIN